ncbi:MAG: cheB, partial [Gemmataceae bacterium]|nr:cheB [Gemmataceae bacterium]
MSPIRVFLVDDSAVVRRLVAEALTGDPAVRVVGTAPNGRVALPLIADLRPDVIVMDVEMPELDGLQTLAAMRVAGLRMPVIMFSTETRRGAVATLDALTLGASDYVTKPVTAGGVGQALEYVRAELLPKIRALAPGRSVGTSGGPPGAPARSAAPGVSGDRRLGPPPSGELARPAPSGE